jgi:hypothetical protein
MSNSRSNPVLTEKQSMQLNTYRDKLDAGNVLTEKMQLEYTALCEKELNGTKVILSDTAIEYLMEAYAWEVHGRRSSKDRMELQQLKKGKLAQTASVELLTVVDGLMYKENIEKERIYNEFLSGEVDAYLGESLQNMSIVVDLKNSFDEPSFLKKINTGLDNGIEEQVQGYMDIGQCEGYIVHALVNMPEVMRLEEKRRLFYNSPGEYISEESPSFLEKWSQIERDMTFDDIPHHQRIFKIKIEPFSESYRQKLYDRVKICREWLSNFHEQYQKLNKN